MHSNKLQEVFIILLPDTLSYPNTMMVEPRDADVTYSTMLGPWRFNKITRCTFIIRNVHYSIIILFKVILILSRILFINYSTRVVACLSITIEWIEGQTWTKKTVNLRYLWIIIKQSKESIQAINYVTSNCYDYVEVLYQRVISVEHIISYPT